MLEISEESLNGLDGRALVLSTRMLKYANDASVPGSVPRAPPVALL